MVLAFTKILLLAEGQTVYFGPSGKGCLQYFRDAGFPFPAYSNPADYMLDLVNTREESEVSLLKNVPEVEMDSVPLDPKPQALAVEAAMVNPDQEFDVDSLPPLQDRAAIILKLVDFYQKHPLSLQAVEPIKDAPAALHMSDFAAGKYVTPFYNQFRTVLVRSFLHKLREPVATMTQMFNGVVMTFILSSIFWQLPNNNIAANDALSVISLLLVMQAFMPFDILLLLPLER